MLSVLDPKHLILHHDEGSWPFNILQAANILMTSETERLPSHTCLPSLLNNWALYLSHLL